MKETNALEIQFKRKIALLDYLKHEFSRRVARNPQYGLRSFALSLQMDPGNLSRIFAGKRSISNKLFTKLMERLPLSGQELESIMNPTEGSSPFQALEMEYFHTISDWYHFAILELTRIESFRSDQRWIAKTLGITLSECKLAIERLQKIGHLEIDENGHYRDLSGLVSTLHHPFSNSALRRWQRQILEKALEALEQIPFEERSQTSLTFALNSQDLPEIKDKINTFRSELTRFVERVEKRDRVYQMSFSLYPVSEKEQVINKMETH